MYSRGGGNEAFVADSTLENDLKLLRGSLRIILEHGWVKYSAGDFEGGFCTMGAISGAIHEFIGINLNAEEIAKKYNAGSVGYKFTIETNQFLHERILPYLTIPDWNDAQERTEADVVALYRAAIENAERLLGIEHEPVTAITPDRSELEPIG